MDDLAATGTEDLGVRSTRPGKICPRSRASKVVYEQEFGAYKLAFDLRRGALSFDRRETWACGYRVDQPRGGLTMSMHDDVAMNAAKPKHRRVSSCLGHDDVPEYLIS